MFKGILRKAYVYYENNGFEKTAIKTLEYIFRKTTYIFYHFYELLNKKKYVSDLRSFCEGKEVFVVIGSIDWYIPLYQRPHQITSVLSKDKNKCVLFISDQYKYDKFSGYKKVNNHFLVSKSMMNKLNDILINSNEKIVLMCWPVYFEKLDLFKYDKLIYEYIDDISLFYFYDEIHKSRHYDLIKKADLTVATATVLYEDALKYSNKVILSENAGDYALFSKTSMYKMNEIIIDKIPKFDKVIGYYGCLAEWFDYELINKVSQLKPDWLFIFIGYDFDGSLNKLEDRDNIMYIPPQKYEDLPTYACAFDLQIIPFIINDITKSTSPVKLFEYMAIGKPILTSKLPECQKYKSVIIYDDESDFIKKATLLMNLSNDDEYYIHLEEDALNNTWDARVNQILTEVINRVE